MRIVIMMPDNSMLTNMTYMQTTVVTATIIIDEKLDYNLNKN